MPTLLPITEVIYCERVAQLAQSVFEISQPEYNATNVRILGSKVHIGVASTHGKTFLGIDFCSN